MKYAIATDVHLNFIDAGDFARFARTIYDADADALFLTGDIAEGPSLVPVLRKLRELAALPIYFVCGNHDFYGSSTARVRAALAALQHEDRNVHYVRDTIHRLTPTTILVGVDGWGDARVGAPDRQRVALADWTYIEDYKAVNADRSLTARKALAESYGYDEGRVLDDRLYEALQAGAQKIIVLTHVPPFKGATWHRGQQSDEDFLPWFTCVETGQVLARYAGSHPHVTFTVYCGHTHSFGVYQHAPNLLVYTHAAAYAAPAIATVIDVD